MSDHINDDKQINHYDKLIKENLDQSLPVILRDILGLNISENEILPDAIQHTKERKSDALQKITDLAGKSYILHLEFQLKDDKNMVYRMAEYSVMLIRKYRLPLKQFVIFLGDTIPQMSDTLDTEYHKFRFTMIRLADVNYKIFLKSDNPGVNILGILGKFEKGKIFEVIKSIVDRIQSDTEGNLIQSKYFEQMRIFVKLRNSIKPQFNKAMESVSTFFKIEDDVWYQQGETSGEAKKSRIVVSNLITRGFSDHDIAEIADINLGFVKKVRAETLRSGK